MKSRVIPVTLLLACMLGAPSCGDGRPARVPVSGKVLIDGVPLHRGTVMFVPSGARSSAGAIDAEGNFSLSCFDPFDGAVMGKHRVQVNGCEPVGLTTLKWHAPKKYANFQSSGIEQEITGPNDSVVINLTWAGGSPFTEHLEGPSQEGFKAKSNRAP